MIEAMNKARGESREAMNSMSTMESMDPMNPMGLMLTNHAVGQPSNEPTYQSIRHSAIETMLTVYHRLRLSNYPEVISFSLA